MDANTTAAIAAVIPLALKWAPAIVAPLAGGLAKAAEKAPPIPYEGKSKAGIVLALLVAALAVRVALAWATGTLGAIDWQAELTTIGPVLRDVLFGAGMAAGGYALWNANKPALPPAPEP